MSIKLRELIRNIRNCKTAAEERSVVAKECALIRTAFKEEDNIYRHRNVAKLLFMNMLGYPTYFGQIECLKLIASSKFSFKRIGYLGLTILLDENTDILMLVTNSIKNDLKNSNQYINGLALCALGNIANTEMCSSLRYEILDLMNINNPYIKKKAAMCAIRILKKTSDMEDLFVDKINNLLEDRNHGVLSAGISLMISLIEKNPQYRKVLKGHTNKIVKILKSCVMSSYSHGVEYDVYGINDPFLQVKILKLLKYLNTEGGATSSGASGTRTEGQSDEAIEAVTEGHTAITQGRNIVGNESDNKQNVYDMEEVNSVLAQVATNTDSTKNVGNAILYECVKTITYISSDPGLLVLAVNVLGKFLQNTDNNIRYVGLCTLQKLLKKDPKTLHIYRNTIIECLKDQDISIRKKALDVAFALITKDSLKVMVKELLNYLLVADIEIKSDIVSNICVAVNKYSPNVQYLLDTYIKLLCLAGNFIQDHIKNEFIYHVLQNSEFHAYVVYKIFFCIKENLNQYALVQVGIWCIGELGDLLVQESNKNVGPDGETITVTHEDVFDLLEKIVKTYEKNAIKELHNINIKDPIQNILYNKSSNIFEDIHLNTVNYAQTSYNNSAYICCNVASESMHSNDNNVILQYVLMCLNKLTVRFPTQKLKIEKIIQKYKKNNCIEIQQRACEFHELMSTQFDDIRDSILLRIPPCTNKKMNRKRHSYVDDDDDVAEVSLHEAIGSQGVQDSGIMNNSSTNLYTDKVSTACVDLLDLEDVLGIQKGDTNNPSVTTDVRSTPPVIDTPNGTRHININKTVANKLDMLDIADDVKISSTHLLSSEESKDNIIARNDREIEIAKKKNEDILADLFGSISIDQPKSSTQGNTSLDLLLDGMPPEKQDDLLSLNVGSAKMQIDPLKVYDKNGVEIFFHFEKENIESEAATIWATYSNKSGELLSSFIFEAVVPNYVKLEILAPSSSELPPGEENKIRQELKIVNKLFKKKPLLMKVRISYLRNGEKLQDFINIGNFPSAL
ncbi:AP-1 complex subunit gamma, putative [Plasmodium knowlesi strain H]|uniref:AP-1 complex subunit gamma n=3 Tax=Plasmodium knowlesi TaxID=5850 RepID=A0A5K1VKE8_PLAKH|nr:AP-1 complex subunit gamma, putative [Plasmodium knowlesi strain H]OTN65269.1 putative AP-1 complex subunit gamma [Plasmodium knowlesi]CAA9989591.1 AP-1 complex subunit gamma, putative [Plasmodium knowlesi strain H]SBO22652.1 AP-1 complex subunit gamma, putative [Plasmodium knowlesi strain H]SBO23370.1 AP-1 complex subunit gamma, putative [Plasmodium knowlesi strain H]VVS79065.1 AP-1 complex subunit gamma, putative [Plasmodium knowlesi strain H]|eukprot:XP_002260316.1 gamma-adaptin, putative [Plasmodium knowlesi strain H]